MRIGFALGNIGPIGSANAIATIAQRAEALGYDSLWTVERLLRPVQPQTPYPVTPDGLLPEEYAYSLDPLDTLSFAAAHTKKVTLGPSVLDMPYYNPTVLARRLTSIDILSNGRLRVGLGLGWSKDEMDATGAEMKERGAKADEFLAVLKAIWTSDPAEFHGKYYQLPKSHISQKPVQKPYPPIYLAAFAPPALKRIATSADGWNPVMIPPSGMAQMFAQIQQWAKEAGRDPSSLQLIVRGNVLLSDQPLGQDRAPFSGTLSQVKDDVKACRDIGAHEVFFDPTFTSGAQSLQRWLQIMEDLRNISS
jgi:probable F420-dependent oxidoreductase